MCRLLAYRGPGIPLRQLLLEPEHSLMVQSWAPREMEGAVLNADGFGFGWYDGDGQPGRYINTCPMWSDVNLETLGRTLSSRLWLANVRSATPGQGLSADNTQPFLQQQFSFLHNGYISDFDRTRARLHAYLAPPVQAGIRGNTDSEYLFALLRQQLAAGGDPRTALLQAVGKLPDLLDGARALLNLVLCDGQSVYACRHALNGGACPSLYLTDRHPDFPGAVLLASEPLSRPQAWEPVPAHTLVTMAADGALQREPL